MTKIEHPENYIVCEFDGVTATTIYYGGMADLSKANSSFQWRYDTECSKMCFDPYKVLTLTEIANQARNQNFNHDIITVIIDAPLSGNILQYGNYGDEWWEIGTFSGYA